MSLQKPNITGIGRSSYGSDRQWYRLRGWFIAVNAFSIACRCGKSSRGAAPHAHLSDGCIDLVLVHACSRFDFLHFLLMMSRSAGPTTLIAGTETDVEDESVETSR
ncbi:unnamed protein product [Protopolystoma xenopodis]|uniref:Ceramide kinase C-terminal domain-containing protein n=1 Tax=Protopolystoma xenopodis TaxID=117903 RepID=A0A448X6Q3_9PLAT|nr:unnamed protein product [Protopolystoma xenopodis]